MKKLFLILFFISSIISCSRNAYLTNSNSLQSSTEDCYKVTRIETVDNYYQIYATKDKVAYKIISREDYLPKKGTKLKVGNCYLLQLKSRTDLLPTIDGVKLVPLNYLDIEYMHENTPIKIDGGSKDLYYADNLKGLYLTDK